MARLKDLNRNRELRRSKPASSLGLSAEARRLVRKSVRFSTPRLGFMLSLQSPRCTLCSFKLLDFQVLTGRLCDFRGSLGLLSSGPGSPVCGNGILAGPES